MSEYTKQNFKSGDTLYAAQLNAMDEQIAANESAIKDLDIKNGIIKGEYYSEKETVIGRWTDGKPLYQITFSFQLSLNTTAKRAEYDLPVTNIENIFMKTAFLNGGGSLPWNRPSQNSFVGEIGYDFNIPSSKIVIETGGDRHDKIATCTIQYTKTTDTSATPIPDSILPSQLMKGEYYSEDEQVIGRWVNNKPLYQKTYVFVGTFYGNMDLGTIDVDYDEFIDMSGMAIMHDGSMKQLCFVHPGAVTNESSSVLIRSARQISLRTGTSYKDTYCYQKIIITIKYTKTTDTAETPIPESILPTSLIKGENHSTEERVIGRWIDGRPLYEKTVSVTINVINTDWTWDSGDYISDNMQYASIVKSFTKTAYAYGSSGYSNDGLGKTQFYVAADNRLTSLSNRKVDSGTWYCVVQYTKTTDSPTSAIQQTLLNSDEVQAMIDNSTPNIDVATEDDFNNFIFGGGN